MTNDLHNLAAAFALDALDNDERALFEAHYPNCDECQADVAAFSDIAASLASTSSAKPPAELRSSVLEAITNTDQLRPALTSDAGATTGGATFSSPGQYSEPSTSSTSPSSRSAVRPSRLRRMAIGAVAAVVLVGGIVAINLGSEPDFGEFASGADAVTATLDPTTAEQAGEIEVAWSPERDQVAIRAVQLPDLDSEQTYALWFLLDDGVAPAGLFSPEAGTVEVVLDVDDLAANGWGITIEPAGGSEQPTSDVLFAGTL